MSASGLRDHTRAAILDEITKSTRILLNDRDAPGEKLHDNIGYIRGLQTAIDTMDTKYAEMNSR